MGNNGGQYKVRFAGGIKNYRSFSCSIVSTENTEKQMCTLYKVQESDHRRDSDYIFLIICPCFTYMRFVYNEILPCHDNEKKMSKQTHNKHINSIQTKLKWKQRSDNAFIT